MKGWKNLGFLEKVCFSGFGIQRTLDIKLQPGKGSTSYMPFSL